MKALPDVTITSTDRRRLVPLATDALLSQGYSVAASMLLREIARATVVPPGSLPPTVVRLNCEFEVRDNINGMSERMRIVIPSEEDGCRHAISVLSLVGATLFGLSEGASIDWCTAARDRRSLTVLRVHGRAQEDALLRK